MDLYWKFRYVFAAQCGLCGKFVSRGLMNLAVFFIEKFIEKLKFTFTVKNKTSLTTSLFNFNC
jgi:hypothetical protein